VIETDKLKDEVKRSCRSAGNITVIVYRELWRTRAFTIAAGLAFYFLLSLVPLVIVFASMLRFFPIANMMAQMLGLMAVLIPPDSMYMIRSVTVSVLSPGHTKLISFGILSYLWAATGGFTALIEALDMAYDVIDCRSWWRERLQAFVLTFTVGGLIILSLLTILVGPRFGHFLMLFFPVPEPFARLWPVLRWIVTIATFVTGLELMYYLGPHTRHSFWSTWRGAAVAVGIWFLGSYGLSFYLDHLSNYNQTYGSLGAVIGLMLWLYISSLAVIIGAELNAELAKREKPKTV
jgi:membrane protein